jgi:membrane protease subunit (stomatin/prohibitin family)
MTDEIKTIMNQKVFDEAIRNRGIQILGFIIESVTLEDESKKKIDNYELSSNAFMQQGALVGGYSRGVEAAGSNPNGAATGMMGVGMVNMASNGTINNATTNAFTNVENSRVDLNNQQTVSTTPETPNNNDQNI